MGSINRVTLLGVIGRPPELKTSIGGKPYVRLSLATYRRTKDENGNTKRETQWHNVMLWGKNAELCSNYCTKGDPLYVEGHLSSYVKGEEGNRTYHLSINAELMQFIPGTRSALSSEHGEIELLERPEPRAGAPLSSLN